MKRTLNYATVLALGLVLAGFGLLSGPGRPASAEETTGLPESHQPVTFVLHQPEPGVSGATIFGSDDRIPIEETEETPWRTISQLYVVGEDREVWGCTGTVLNYNVVLTAAHCIYDDVTESPAFLVMVVPGSNGDFLPFESAFAIDFSIPQGYVDDPVVGSPYDFALLYLEGSPFGNALGPYMPLYAPSNPRLASASTMVSTVGYAIDNPFGAILFAAKL